MDEAAWTPIPVPAVEPAAPVLAPELELLADELDLEDLSPADEDAELVQVDAEALGDPTLEASPAADEGAPRRGFLRRGKEADDATFELALTNSGSGLFGRREKSAAEQPVREPKPEKQPKPKEPRERKQARSREGFTVNQVDVDEIRARASAAPKGVWVALALAALLLLGMWLSAAGSHKPAPALQVPTTAPVPQPAETNGNSTPPAATTPVYTAPADPAPVSPAPGAQVTNAGGRRQLVAVPSLAGSTAAAAKRALAAQGLKAKLVKETSETVPAGVVVKQNPRSGATVTKGQTVTATVSSGPAPKPLPFVVGLSAVKAQLTLERLGYAVKTVQVKVFATKGQVVGQDPQPGKIIPHGATVTLKVAAPPTLKVPHLLGKTVAEAGRLLRAKKLKVQVMKEHSNVAAGTVVSETPPPGTPVASGMVVTIGVSDGKAPVATPKPTTPRPYQPQHPRP
jgi:beta-lactam-binding protein with PASTA domain